VVRAAVELGLENGAKLRVDSTVVQTDIHHPTDNTLLWDVVRVVTRLVRRLAKALELRRILGFCDRTRAARRQMYEIRRMTTRQRHDQQTHTYRVLIDIAEEVVANARAGLEGTRTMRRKDMFADMTIEELRRQIEHFCGLGDRVIDQAKNVDDKAFDLPIFEQGVGDWAALIGIMSHGIAFADRLRFKLNNLNTSIEFGTLNVDTSTDSINLSLDLHSANPTIVGEANAYSFLPFGVIPIPLGWRDELCPDINMTNMRLIVQLVMAVVEDQLSYNDVRVVLDATIDGGAVGNAVTPVVDFRQKIKSSFESQVRSLFISNQIRPFLSEAFMQMVRGQAKSKVFFVTSVRLDQSGMLVSYPVR
jgi:hypothetical protein